jgi:opacity protein-like surface antigen
MRVAAVWVSALLLVLAADAAAQNDSGADADFARTGFYVGVSSVFAPEDFSGRFQGVSVDPDHGWGASLRGGWRFSERGAVEILTEWTRFNVSAATGPDRDFDSLATTANLKWIFPLGRVEPFALFGIGPHVQVGRNSAGRTAVAFAWRGGAGFQIHVNEALSVLAEGSYLGTSARNEEIPYGSLGLGLQYRF